MASTDTPIQKTASDLVLQISILEREIVRLESHLLSIYRSAFENYFSSSPITSSFARSSSVYEAEHTNEELDLSPVNVGADKISFNSYSHLRYSPAQEPASSSNSIYSRSHVVDRRMKMRKSRSDHHTLADYLGTNIQDHISGTTFMISEDIIKCISSICCKLTSSRKKHMELLPSSSSSSNSSVLLSPENLCNSWSPQFWCEAASSSYGNNSPKQKHDPYEDMIEVSKICMDDDQFEFAFKMLKIFRSLIRRLEDVDPRKMEQNEQLAFWINIHNALTMHAFLACGLQKNVTRNNSSIHRAAYNIGGCSVNTSVIQKLILGCCHPQCSSSHLRYLFASERKLRKVGSNHPYALHHPEPLAYFALCMGASSDPAVRLYTAKDVHQELIVAKREYIQSYVSIQKTKIILPKLLHYYAKAASKEPSDLIKMVACNMEEDVHGAMQQCFQKNGSKSVTFSPFKTDFRFLFHNDLVKQ
ncbi:uncharacterized protein LOC110019596 [Phalaenopsis equestris]|uniref:uncharacterized protein LOC110019596 n=1 Tax=Phalaenopsis equestris TaxID=78828 RepID=UPI0009E35770|nr:uncharacterized protein LOC110019596 [Phalaenopsis equestris]